MTKFLNKKEQVYDLKLTGYGHYLLSVGKFKPIYYTFCDDNVLYDGQYAGISERQNEIHNRIKNQTPYLEGLTLFEDLENLTMETAEEVNFYSSDVTATQKIPRKDTLRMSAVIGDGNINGSSQKAPAWKVIALQGAITSSTSYEQDDQNVIDIPQLNMSAVYKKKIVDFYYNYSPTDPRQLSAETGDFVDNKSFTLIRDEPLLYLEEMNTEIFVENFSVEVYEVLTGSNSAGQTITQLQRKYFMDEEQQIKNGLLMTERPSALLSNPFASDQPLGTPTTDNVEYYFDVMTDQSIDLELACRAAIDFNKESYYVDLDFDCDAIAAEGDQFFDIYGSETEPEVCQ